MKTVESKVRKVERQLGAAVILIWEQGELVQFWTKDEGESGETFITEAGTPSRHFAQLQVHHERVYRARAREKFKQQKGLCAICGEKMPGTQNTEADHIKSRGRNGRDDRMENLRIVHGEPCHRQRHGG